jgi:undecaprenyl-diphosphatase
MVTETAVQIGLFVLALWLAPDKISLGRIDTRKMVVVALVAVLVLLVATAAVSSVRRLRQAVIPRVTKAAHAVWDAIRSPWRITLVIAGNVGAQVLYAASILACLHAFGASVNFWTVLALNIGVSTIASLVPVPGGGNALSVIGLSGVLVSVGVSATAAAAAVLVHQVVANYLPAIPGWFATHDLARKSLL